MLSTLMIKQVALVSSPAVKRERQSIKYFLKMKISFFSNCTISNCTFHEVVFNSLTILFSYRKRQFVVNYNYHYNLYSVIITFFFLFLSKQFCVSTSLESSNLLDKTRFEKRNKTVKTAVTINLKTIFKNLIILNRSVSKRLREKFALNRYK